MSRVSLAGAAAICALAFGSLAASAAPDWRVVAADSDSGLVLPPLLPSATGFDLAWVTLADAGNGAIGFARSPGSGPYSLWSERNGTLAPFAENLATGNLGPGRTGAEGGDVFRSLYQKHDANGQGYRVFGARAGESTQPADAATYGVWLWDGARNTEIARLNSEGALGPGFGAGVAFTSFGGTTSATFPMARALPGQRVLFDAVVTGSLQAVIMHTAGVGNRGCLLEGSTDPAYAPGIGSAAFYDNSGSFTIGAPVVGARGEVYIASAFRDGSTSGRGIFSLCQGAPQVRARTAVSGDLGPGLSDIAATFSEFAAVRPGAPGEFYFWAKASSTSTSASGGFRHAGGRNTPVYLANTESELGPGYTGYVFNQTSAPALLRAAGRYGLLQTTIKPIAGTTSISGLWRLTPGASPEPLAIVGDSGAYAPAPGRTWREFHRAAILDSGEVLVVAEISNPTTRGVWRLRRGQSPEQVLGAGDTVQVPTSAGLVSRQVTSVSSSAVDPDYLGDDHWASENGTVLIRAGIENITSNSSIFLRGLAGRSETVLAAGFD